jgi:hypothetical protein
MRMVRRKAPWFGAVALLTLGGVGAGVLASSLTSDAIVWRAPSHWSATEQVAPEPIDQTKAGESWARTAFAGGLKRCPPINAAFLAGCEAEMKLLAARPAFPAGSYGGPLLITKVETVPEPEIDEYQPEPELEFAPYEDDYPRTPAKAGAQESQAPELDSGPRPSPGYAVGAPTPANYPAATEHT